VHNRSQRGRTHRVFVQRHGPTGDWRRPDELIVEEPLSIQLDGTLVATTMRTPGHDYELAVGFLHADGMLGGALVTGVRYCADGPAVESQFNVVTVETGGKAPTPTPRLGSTSSSCGLCGADAIDELTDRLLPLDAKPFDPLLLAEVASQVRSKQELFDKTGAVHAAASFNRDGEIAVVREDIGRHNAVDKIVGRMVIDGEMPTSDLGLYVSGRASFEMVQKAWAGGFASVVSVSAPSALAVQTATAANLQLAGFIRNGEINVY
jgi:FdhD protein